MLRYAVMTILEVARQLALAANRPDLAAQCEECIGDIQAAEVLHMEKEDNHG